MVIKVAGTHMAECAVQSRTQQSERIFQTLVHACPNSGIEEKELWYDLLPHSVCGRGGCSHIPYFSFSLFLVGAHALWQKLKKIIFCLVLWILSKLPDVKFRPHIPHIKKQKGEGGKGERKKK